MDETNKFKIWDWDTNDWLQIDQTEDVVELNWYNCGENEGVTWAELKHLPHRNLGMIFEDNDGNFKDPRGE